MVGSRQHLPVTMSECDFQRITAGGMPPARRPCTSTAKPVNSESALPLQSPSRGWSEPPGWLRLDRTAVHAHADAGDQGTLSIPATWQSPCRLTCSRSIVLDQDYLIAIYGKHGRSTATESPASLCSRSRATSGTEASTAARWTNKNAQIRQPAPARPTASLPPRQASSARLDDTAPHGGFNFGAVVVIPHQVAQQQKPKGPHPS